MLHKSIKIPMLLMLVFGLVLCIACSNVCNYESSQHVTVLEGKPSGVVMPLFDDGGFYLNIDKDGTYLCGSAIDIHGVRLAFLDYDLDWVDSAKSDDSRYVRAFFRFTNNSDSDISCGGSYFSCSADGLDCESVYVGDAETLVTNCSLEPKQTIDGWLYYEVPKDAQVIDIAYKAVDNESYTFTLDG